MDPCATAGCKEIQRNNSLTTTCIHFFIKQMLNWCSVSIRVIPTSWKDLVSGFLETGSQKKNGVPGSRIMLRLLNNGLKLKVGKSPNIPSLEKERMYYRKVGCI